MRQTFHQPTSKLKMSETDKKPVLCNLCGEEFIDEDSLIVHKEEEHNTQHFFACAECKTIFTSEGDLDRHLEARCTPSAINVNNSMDSGLSSSPTDDLDDGGVNPTEQCSNVGQEGSVQEGSLELSPKESSLNIEESDNQYNYNQYGRSFSRYLQVLYRKIIRKCRRYRPKKFVVEIRNVSEMRRSNSKRRKKRQIRSVNIGGVKETGTCQKPCHCAERDKICEGRHALNVHFRIHTDDKSYQCDHCNKTFVHKNNLMEYLKIHTLHRGDRCNKGFIGIERLAEHQKMHQDDKSYNLRLDVRNKMLKYDNEHKSCQNVQSGSVFYRRRIFTSPPKNHSRNESFKCEQCSKVFKQKSTLTQHIRLHSGIKPYKCDQCDKSFALKTYLKVHERIHTGEKPYQCNQCKKAFTQKGTLNQHLKIHSGKRGRSYMYNRSTAMSPLTQHFGMTHSGDMKFRCNHCCKTFSPKQHLTYHLRTHTGEKPFQCEQCDKAFAVKCNLTQHLRTHSGEKPFQCELCDKAFVLKHHLTLHLRTHSSEKPFQCDQCDKAFKGKDHLTRHRKIHIQ